jgi:hypothetical protein
MADQDETMHAPQKLNNSEKKKMKKKLGRP